MKLLFVNPCLRRDVPHRLLPVGLAYIMTAARVAGYDFDLLDIDLDQIEDDDVEKYIRNNKYDVIAFGCMVTHYKWVKWFVKTIKEHQPNCIVIVGNSVGSSCADILMANAPVDIVTRGESDVTIVELLDAINRGIEITPLPLGTRRDKIRDLDLTAIRAPNDGGIEGIVFRNRNGEVIDNGARKAIAKIDQLPWPDWDLFDIERYIDLGKSFAQPTTFYPIEDVRAMPINTARGCVFKCTFCHYVYWDDPYRHRSAESVLGEMKRNIDKYGANYFHFYDELTFHKIEPMEKFLDAVIEADLNVHFTCALRSDLFGRDEIPRAKRLSAAKKLRDAGCVYAAASLESASNEILEIMNKKVKSEYFTESVKVCREVGVPLATSIVVGYPQETVETIRHTYNFLRDLGIYPSTGFLLPMPSTGMWTYGIENGHITDPDKYLDSITERQDLVLNMTKLPDEVLMREVLEGCQRINEAKDLGLDPDRLIRTGGYAKHVEKRLENETEIEERRAKYSTNIVDSLNYAKVSGTM